jgi:hypothetical protein
MTTTQPAPNAAPENVSQAGAPNQYHLHGHGIQISYYPEGAGPPTVDGPIVFAYQDANHTATFRRSQAQVVAVEGLGTCVTVTLQILVDVGTRTATLLVPSVVLGAQTSAPVHTELIRTVHTSTLTGIGHPQRDNYTVTSLTGQASVGILPL